MAANNGFICGYAVLTATLLWGCYKYAYLDAPARLVVVFLLASALTETAGLRGQLTGDRMLKNIVYHLCPIVELIIISAYFILLNNPAHRRRLIIVATCLWLLLGAANTVWLQPIRNLNTNMLMVECFTIITMCLHSIYRMLQSDAGSNIFGLPHFWISILWLLEWSSTFFFWAFVKILYKSHWAYMDLVMNLHIAVNMIMYAGIVVIFFYYPKKSLSVENC